jgi:glycosidase
MKGYTSIYYKSEIGIKGMRDCYSDEALRPSYSIEELEKGRQSPLYKCLTKLGQIRKAHPTLCFGRYEEVVKESDLIGYKREDGLGSYLVLINSSDKIRNISLKDLNNYQKGYDILNNEMIEEHRIEIHPAWGRIVKLR